jgi:EmrB/QacA subfamily drug resistance transporter
MRRPSQTAVLLTVAFGVFVAADDLTAVSTMLRRIVFDLQIPLPDRLDDAVWIVNAYLIAYVAVMPFAGRLSDLWGRRPVYIGSMALFLLGSIWIPQAPDLNWFIAGRVLTAIGGGALVPIAMAVAADVYESPRRPTALGALGAVETAGWVWGPLYGALLVRYLTWQWLFHFNVILGVIGIALGWWYLRDLPQAAQRERKAPEGHEPERKQRERIDWAGAATLTIGLVALNMALLNSGNPGAADTFADLSGTRAPVTWPFYLLAVVALALFVLIERRVPNPLIQLRLFRRPNFSVAGTVNWFIGGILIIAMVNVPLFVNVLEFDLEKAALDSGRLLSAMTASMAIMAFGGGRLAERWGYRAVTLAGLLACTAGFALMGSTWTATTPYLEMAWQLAILGAGFGLVMAPLAAASINAAPDDQRGVAASLVIVFRLIGMSVGLSALTAWGLYRFEILRGQIELPPLADPDFQAAIIEALTHTTVTVLNETFLISALIAVVALIAAVRLRGEAPGGGD